LLAFGVRAFTPVGYMPGSLADGTFFVLCPGGNPAIANYLAAREAAPHPAHAHENHSESATIWDQCSFAAAALLAAASFEASAFPLRLRQERPFEYRSAIKPSTHRLPNRARGPPASSIGHV
jgi:hypothetical protein